VKVCVKVAVFAAGGIDVGVDAGGTGVKVAVGGTTLGAGGTGVKVAVGGTTLGAGAGGMGVGVLIGGATEPELEGAAGFTFEEGVAAKAQDINRTDKNIPSLIGHFIDLSQYPMRLIVASGRTYTKG
jgi:hypothetical protein